MHGPAFVTEEHPKIVEADEVRDTLDPRVERQPQRVDQRHDHDGGVDQQGRRQEHRDVKPRTTRDRSLDGHRRRIGRVDRKLLDVGHVEVSPSPALREKVARSAG